MSLTPVQANKIKGLYSFVDMEWVKGFTKEQASELIDHLVQIYRTYENRPVADRVPERLNAMKRLIKQAVSKYGGDKCKVCGGSKVSGNLCHC